MSAADPEGWLRQIAVMAVRIHDAQVAAGPFEERIDAAAPVIPASATRPAVWEAAFGILRRQPPEPATCFIHRDFQHFNLLWQRGRLTGVVDWTRSCTGPADFDVGHCRLNLAVLFGADWAERFRLAYEADAGRAIDPWWDLYAVTAYSDEWRRFIPVQVARRAPVDPRHDIPRRRSTGSDVEPALRCGSVASAPLGGPMLSVKQFQVTFDCENLSASLVSGARCWGTSYRRHRRGSPMGRLRSLAAACGSGFVVRLR